MQKSKFNNIICFGEVLWDMLPAGAKPGGAPLNAAIHLNKHRIHPTLVSKVGDDTEGEELKEFLNRSGLSTAFIQTDISLPTSKVLVTLDKQKNASYNIIEPVAWDNIQYTSDLEQAARLADLILFGSLASRSNITRKTLYQLLETSKAIRLLDVNLRPPFDKQEFIEELLQKSDFIKLNNDELQQIAMWNNINGSEKERIHRLAQFYNCDSICVTRGAGGAVFYVNQIFYEHPGFQVNAVDTVGAGDAFLASLLAKLSNGHSPQDALEYACATGALVASRKGAVPDYSEADIKKIKKRPNAN
ncbi:MAG: carbohydrate kinase family protein [Prolixibacteraceae bacterium]